MAAFVDIKIICTFLCFRFRPAALVNYSQSTKKLLVTSYEELYSVYYN